MITFADFVTPAGAALAAPIITGTVQLVKTVLPMVDEKVSGALLSFVFSAVLYVVTALVLSPLSPDGYLNVFLTWLTVAGLAIGIKSTVDHGAKVVNKRAKPKKVIGPNEKFDPNA